MTALFKNKRFMSIVLCIGGIALALIALSTYGQLFTSKDSSAVKSFAISNSEAAIVKADGTLWTWEDLNANPKKVLDSVIDVKLGSSIGAALRDDGTVWVWGNNLTGSLGNGTRDISHSVIIPQQVENVRNVKSIQAHTSSIFAIHKDGSVTVWGSNGGGKLGLKEGADPWIMTPVKNEWEDVKMISVGLQETIILRKDGTVWNTTESKDGELERIEGLDDVISIDAGIVSIALTKDGDVYQWGYQIPLQKVKDIPRMTAIEAGETHIFARTGDGDLYGWGLNYNGELGFISEADVQGEQPRIISSMSPIDKVAAGSEQTLFLTKDQKLWGVGVNPRGIIGIEKSGQQEQTIFALAPISIPE